MNPAKHEHILKEQNTALDSIAVQIWAADSEGTIRWVNKAKADALGIEKDYAVDKNIKMLCSSEWLENYQKIYEKLSCGGEKTGTETWLPAADGKKHLIRTSARPVCNNRDGKTDFFIFMAEDITEEHRLQQKLAETRKLYKMLVENQNDLICQYSPDFVITYANDTYAKYFGNGRRELTGIHLSDLLSENEFREVRKTVKILSPESPSRKYENRTAGKKETTCWRQWLDKAVFDRNGNALNYQAVGRDITDLKKTEEKLLRLYGEIEEKVHERTNELEKTNKLLNEEVRTRKTSEKQLLEMLKSEKIISEIASDFISEYSFDKKIESSLEKIGKAARADRAYLFTYDRNSCTMSNSHEWCAPGIPAEKDNLQDLPMQVFPWWNRKITANEIILIRNLDEMPAEAAEEKKILETQDIRSLAVLPVAGTGGIIGFVGFDDTKVSRSWNETELEMLKIFANIISNAITRKDIEDEFKKSEAYYRTVFETTNAPTIIIDEKGFISRYNRQWEKLFGKTTGQRHWKDVVHRKDIEMVENNRKRRLGGEKAPAVYQIRLIPPKKKIIHTQMTVDIIPGTKTIVASFADITELKKYELQLQESNRKISGVFEQTIEVLSSLQGMLDLYTSGHQKRTALLSIAVGEKMNLGEKRIQGLKTAAFLHDLGKLNIPQSILTKPDRLTPQEFELIKTHPEAGARIIGKINFEAPVSRIIIEHHEKLDGSGYPAGLDGSDMLLESKILAVADVVEAMTSHRPYRPALTIEAAKNELKKNRGLKYDSDVVDAMLEVIEENNWYKSEI